MSMHKKELTPLERAGLEAHGLDIGTPSQLSDAFRQGVAFALAGASEPVDFNEDVILPLDVPLGAQWSVPVTVSFDGAEGRGRVWLSDDVRDERVAIEGPNNCRKLAYLLNAWADACTGGDK